MNNLHKRILSSFVLISFIVLALLSKAEVFITLLGLLVFSASFEWHSLYCSESLILNTLYAILNLVLYAVVVFYDFEWLIYLSVAYWFYSFVELGIYVKYPSPGIKPNYLKYFLSGILLIVATGYALASLREFGMEFIIALFIWVGSMDIGAFITGKKFGNHKLLVDVSPGKTIEGVIGGIFVVVATTLIVFYAFELDSYSLLEYIIVSVLIALFAVVGDLYESMLKREFSVKDSGSIIPGHGGILDRIDSLTAAAPVLAAIITFMPS